MKEEVKNKTHVKITYNTYKKMVKTFPIKIFNLIIKLAYGKSHFVFYLFIIRVMILS